MYNLILITLDTTPTDRAIIDHVKILAVKMNSRVVLLHVVDGWAGRTFGSDAVTPEIQQDQDYLLRVKQEFEAANILVETELAFGDPATEIVKWVRQRHCDLVAMSTHGHRLLADLVLGTTASKVQHQIDVPVLLIRAR